MEGDTPNRDGPPARPSPPRRNGLSVLPVRGRVSGEPVSNLTCWECSGRLRLGVEAVSLRLTVPKRPRSCEAVSFLAVRLPTFAHPEKHARAHAECSADQALMTGAQTHSTREQFRHLRGTHAHARRQFAAPDAASQHLSSNRNGPCLDFHTPGL